MITRLIIQYSGRDENNRATQKFWAIIIIEGDINISIVKKHLENEKTLSAYRKNKDIEIYSMQAF